MTVTYANILLIDDDRRRSSRLSRPFGAWGWRATRLTGDPLSALLHMADEPVDLVLLDIAAAERDDYAFLRAWRDDPHLSRTPVIVVADAAQPDTSPARLVRCIELGAGDAIVYPANPVLLHARLQNVLQKKLLEEQASTALEAFNEIEKVADDLRLIILPIGASLSAETDQERLLEKIVGEALRISNADAGVLYLAGDDGLLHYAYLHVASLGLTFGGASGEPMPFEPLPLALEDDQPNYSHIAAYVALTGESVNLSEVHEVGQFDFSRLTSFEERFNYEAHSCLTVPLRSGQVIGSLALFNSRDPIGGAILPFDAYHQQVAESLASQAAVALNNRLLSERQVTLMRYKRELEIGRDIQLSFLPERLPAPNGWELAADYRPALEVAGDFYDAMILPHGHLGLVIADVVGKGVTAALFMAIIRSLYRALFQQYYLFRADPAEVANPYAAAPIPFSFVDYEALLNAVRLTNSYLINNHRDSHIFATIFCGLLYPDSGRLLYVNAGHNPPFLLGRPEGGRRTIREQLAPTGPAIGLLADPIYRLSEAQLAPGDMLFAYTDGVTETRDLGGEDFSVERLAAILSAQIGGAGEAIEAVKAAVRGHMTGAEPFDDMTMLALRRLPPDEQPPGAA